MYPDQTCPRLLLGTDSQIYHACQGVLEGLIAYALRRGDSVIRLQQGYRHMRSAYGNGALWTEGPQYPKIWFDQVINLIRLALPSTISTQEAYFKGNISIQVAGQIRQVPVNFSRIRTYGSLLLYLPQEHGLSVSNAVLWKNWRAGDFADHT
jgi:hypothetical protein